MFKRSLKLMVLLLALFGIVGCGNLGASNSSLNQPPPPTSTSSGASPVVVASPTAQSAIAPTSISTAVPAINANAPGGAAPSAADESAIKNVIQKANQEQVQAVANNNPGVMQDTATATYYQQSVQTLSDLLNSGVTAIQLVNLAWGPITMQSSTSAQATTSETWRTAFSDGSSMQETDTNVYTMVLQNGAWLVQDDQHPDSRVLQSPSGSPGGVSTPIAPAAPAGGAQSQSRNWAGYSATGGKFTSVTGTWKVPNVSAGTNAADATWVGIGGVNSRDLIQAGTQATVQGGQVVYSAWWETLPQASQDVPLNIATGDTITVTITQQSNGTWQITIKDATNNGSYQRSVNYQSSLSSAEWIEESPAVGRRMLLPLDNFGTVTFTKSSAVENGKQLSIAQAGGQPVTLSAAQGQILAQPSTLANNGSSFSVTRSNITAPGLLPGGRNGP